MMGFRFPWLTVLLMRYPNTSVPGYDVNQANTFGATGDWK